MNTEEPLQSETKLNNTTVEEMIGNKIKELLKEDER